jgi:1-phosphofructokinase family hexose kinase
MENEPSIITIGLSPAWDITCIGRNIEWGKHQIIDEQTILPAGKAFNISRALAWMGQKSIAAGLWGNSDFEKMQSISRELWPLIDIRLSVVGGQTRMNMTIVDSANQKEMHLRNKSNLTSGRTLRQLESDLEKIVKKENICVFSGALPESEYLDEVVGIIEKCRNAGAKIVLDTSGSALKRIVETGLVRMIKPNVEELKGLVGEEIEDNAGSLIKTGRTFLDRVENILLSRGKEGAIFINKCGEWDSKAVEARNVLGTVGCGDYLLAGFLKGWNDTSREDFALSIAVKAAAAKAWGWTQLKSWPEVMEQVDVKLNLLK